MYKSKDVLFFVCALAFTALIMGTTVAKVKNQDMVKVKEKPVLNKPAVTKNGVKTNEYPQVIEVSARNIPVDADDSANHKLAQPDQYIMVRISHPGIFLQQRPFDKSKVVLYAENIELKGITCDILNNLNIVKQNKTLTKTDSIRWFPFRLIRDSTTKEAWDCLYRISNHWYSKEVKVHITIGWQYMFPVPNQADPDHDHTLLTINFYGIWYFMGWMAFFIAFLIGVSYIAITSNMLRESDGGQYSLSQTQLAFWTILIIGGFIYTYVLTDIISSLNTSILLLLGISITTGSAAAYIGYYQRNGDEPIPKKPSKGFFTDILGDGTTITVARVQVAAWTLVLGIYYVFFVINNKTMPVFPDVLLYLTGISSASYIAAKPTEVPPK